MKKQDEPLLSVRDLELYEACKAWAAEERMPLTTLLRRIISSAVAARRQAKEEQGR